jgi:hypothetical protein
MMIYVDNCRQNERPISYSPWHHWHLLHSLRIGFQTDPKYGDWEGWPYFDACRKLPGGAQGELQLLFKREGWSWFFMMNYDATRVVN